MIIVKLMGGLGNQMFQYALGKALAARRRTPLKLDLHFLLDRTPRSNFVFRDYDLDVFRVDPAIATRGEVDAFLAQPVSLGGRIVRKLRKCIHLCHEYSEPHYHFDPQVFSLPADAYLDGYWQSPKYFASVEAGLRDDFAFRDVFTAPEAAMAEEIQAVTSVCVNVRRTDFLTSNFHGVCDMKYYEPAIRLLASRLSRPRFYVFSDDPAWCLANFRLPFDFRFVQDEYAGRKYSTKLRLMAACRHFIIPNSSFAWWAAWLNGNPAATVVAPTKWFNDPTWDSKDLIPGHWIRIEN